MQILTEYQPVFEKTYQSLKEYNNNFQNEWKFDYHGIEKALCGKTAYWEEDELLGEFFTPKRILVIQMK